MKSGKKLKMKQSEYQGIIRWDTEEEWRDLSFSFFNKDVLHLHCYVRRNKSSSKLIKSHKLLIFNKLNSLLLTHKAHLEMQKEVLYISKHKIN